MQSLRRTCYFLIPVVALAIIVMITLFLWFPSYSAHSKLDRIQPGMSQEEVVEIMGRLPDRSVKQEGYRYSIDPWFWRFGPPWNRYELSVLFESRDDEPWRVQKVAVYSLRSPGWLDQPPSKKD